MAKLITRNGRRERCKILNESANFYRIEYNGRIGDVYKNRVCELDEIDEAVLDRIRGGLRKFGTGVRALIDKIRPTLVRVCNGLFHVFKISDDSDQIMVGSPITGYELAQNPNSYITSFHLSRDLQEYLMSNESLGEAVCNITTVSDDKEERMIAEHVHKAMNEAFSKGTTNTHNRIHESLGTKELKTTSAFMPVPREVKSSKGELMMLTYNFNELYDAILQKVMPVINDEIKIEDKAALCIWGPPGVGKSSIIKNIVVGICTRLHNEYNETFSWASVTAATLKADDIYLPSSIEEVEGNITRKTWSSEPLKWFPGYSESAARKYAIDKGLKAEDYLAKMDDIANGSIYDKEGNLMSKGNGGILFVDEFSTISEKETKDAFKSLITDKTIGNNIRLGSKWVIIFAANRKTDLNITKQNETLFDTAMGQRLYNVNYIPTVEEWIATYASNEESFGGQKIIIEIQEFLREKDEMFINIETNSKDMTAQNSFTDIRPSSASPRAWSNFSTALKLEMLHVFNESAEVKKLRDELEQSIKDENEELAKQGYRTWSKNLNAVQKAYNDARLDAMMNKKRAADRATIMAESDTLYDNTGRLKLSTDIIRARGYELLGLMPTNTFMKWLAENGKGNSSAGIGSTLFRHIWMDDDVTIKKQGARYPEFNTAKYPALKALTTNILTTGEHGIMNIFNKLVSNNPYDKNIVPYGNPPSYGKSLYRLIPPAAIKRLLNFVCAYAGFSNQGGYAQTNVAGLFSPYLGSLYTALRTVYPEKDYGRINLQSLGDATFADKTPWLDPNRIQDPQYLNMSFADFDPEWCTSEAVEHSGLSTELQNAQPELEYARVMKWIADNHMLEIGKAS